MIAKEIRDHLGVRPGWLALQRIVDDHVEIYFVPPEHGRSLRGSLAEYTTVKVPAGEEWQRARERAWELNTEESKDHYSFDDRFPSDGIKVRRVPPGAT